MKTLKLKMLLLFFLMSGGIALIAQDFQSEVPGDDFSLEGALELFKKSSSPEEFERMLNSADARVNNLDLNGDGQIDYIRVIDKNRGNIHAFILQAVISDNEVQDIAVIELEKLGNGKAVLQITGDEDIYGIETIIEPTEEVRINAGTMTTRTVVNVWAWPSVQYIYSPYYTVWVSPWHWHLRPVWWRSWSPIVYYDYYSYWNPYRPYYSHCHTHRVVYARDLYRPHRASSVIVHNRHHDRVVQYRSSRQQNERYADNNGNSSRQDKSGYAPPASTRTIHSNEKYRSERSVSTNSTSDFKSREEKQHYKPIENTRNSEKQSFEKKEYSKQNNSFNRSNNEKKQQDNSYRSYTPQKSTTFQRSGTGNGGKSSAPREIKSNSKSSSSGSSIKRSEGSSSSRKKN